MIWIIKGTDFCTPTRHCPHVNIPLSCMVWNTPVMLSQHTRLNCNPSTWLAEAQLLFVDKQATKQITKSRENKTHKTALWGSLKAFLRHLG